MIKQFKQKYKLELHWDKINYFNNKTAVLIGAMFKGPVLKNALTLNYPDFIYLDFTPQLISLLDSYYTIRLDWKSISYIDNIIKLNDAFITNEVLKEFHKINNNDYILINTEKHEENIHAYNLLYESQVIRVDNHPYKYNQ